jgi:arabinogalactan oligomer/maltooligosaccharide transport system substrate-binding protein
MKVWSKVASGIVSVGLIGGMLAGCSSSSNNSASNNTTSGAVSKIPSGQTITIWSWDGKPKIDVLKKAAAAWAKQYGDTVNVVDQSANANGFQFYATSARTGKGPDIVYGMPHDNNGQFAQQGLIEPIPNGVINPEDYTKEEIDAVKVNGKIYSMPTSVETTALYYNTDKIKTAPKTWDEFVQDANQDGLGFEYSNVYFNYAFVGGLGGYVFKNKNGTLDPKDIGLGNQGAVQAYSLLHDMNVKYHWMTPDVTDAIAKAQFSSGKIGMYISGPWNIPDFKKAGVHYAIAPLPTFSNGQPATPYMGVKTAFVNARSPQNLRPAEWSLLQAITSATQQEEFFKQTQQIPALVKVQNEPMVQSNTDIKAFTDQVKTAVPMPNIPQMQAVWGAMSVIKNIISGKVSPEEGAKDFVNNVKKGIEVQGS